MCASGMSTSSNARLRFSGCQLLGQNDGFAAIDSPSDWNATSTIITTGTRVIAVTRKPAKTTSLRTATLSPAGGRASRRPAATSARALAWLS